MLDFRRHWLTILSGAAALVLVVFAISVIKTNQGETSPTPRVTSDDPILGSSGGVKIIVFTDFACEFCKAEVPILKSILADYQKDVQLVFKDAPLPTHPTARRAAEIARCAQDQGKFWQMHDALFEKQTQLGTIALADLAKDAEVDAAALEQCMSVGGGKARVDASVAESQRMLVNDVPTIFIGDERFTGLQEENALRQAINSRL